MLLRELNEDAAKQPHQLLEEREHILVSMVKKLLAANAKIYMHHGDPALMKMSDDPEIVYDIEDTKDHICLHLMNARGEDDTSASITDYKEADRAKLVKRKSRSKRPVWDLYILS